MDYVKFNMQEENFSETYYFAMAIVLLSVFAAIPLLVQLSRRFGKRRVLAYACFVEGIICVVACAVPPSMMAGGPFYVLCGFFGFGMARRPSPPTAAHSLPTTCCRTAALPHYSPLTTHYSLLTTHDPRLTTHYY